LERLDKVVDTVMARPVIPGYPRAPGTDHNRQTVQPDVEVPLVDRPAEEGREDRHNRSETAHRHPGRGCERVLLGDADVQEALGIAVLERQKPGRAWHGRRDRHYAVVEAS